MRRPGCALMLVASVAAAQAAPSPPTGQVLERVACQRDPSQTYALYLPRTYNLDRRWPTLLVMDPRGRAVTALELFREAAERHGWIVLSSYDIRSDGPAEPSIKALNAMWPEALLRYSTDHRRVYAAGFSGGAHLAWTLGQTPDALAGVIAVGGRFIPELLPGHPTYATFTAAGDTDFNYQGTRAVDRLLATRGVPHRLEIFKGPHQWMPRELAALAVQWMELQAMRRGLRERNVQLIETAYRAEVGAARELEVSGQVLAAGRRFQAIAHGFAGLTEVGEPEAAASRLAALPAFMAAVEEEQRADAFESGYDVRLGQAIGTLENQDSPMTTRRLLAALDITAVQRQAAEQGVAGVTARRILNRVFTQTAFYLPREFLANQQIPQAIISLEVAVAIRPEDGTVWYNLACARSRGGQVKAALDALGEALDHGFRDVALLESDPDLAAVRKREAFRNLLARLLPSS